MKYAFIIIWLLALVACDNPLRILGPRDKPQIVSDGWNQIQVTYWIYTKDSKKAIERNFTLSNQAIIEELKGALIPVETSGLSIGTDRQLIFKNDSDETWHGSFCFADTLYLSLSADAGRSYKFVLGDISFYNQIRQLCAANERKIHPEATVEHIKLQTNLSFDYPKLGH